MVVNTAAKHGVVGAKAHSCSAIMRITTTDHKSTCGKGTGAKPMIIEAKILAVTTIGTFRGAEVGAGLTTRPIEITLGAMTKPNTMIFRPAHKI